ncbi:MAG: hypothetical protein JNM53_08185 [Gemmatimonadetes bacterium]|nr:hypothetical protein [Gemmatimonadota bacterium]
MIASLLRWSTGRMAALGVALMVIVGQVVFRFGPYPRLEALPGGADLPETASTAPELVAAYLERIGPEGRELYARFQWFDLLNPVLICVALVPLIGWLIGRAGVADRPWRYLILLPFVAGAMDLVEDFLLMGAIAAYPAAGAGSGVLPLITMLKFGAVVLALPAVLGLSIAGVLRARRGR